MKPECIDDDVGFFSPETRALIKGLGDSPESLQLKAEILNAANGLRRGHNLVFIVMLHMPWMLTLFFTCLL